MSANNTQILSQYRSELATMVQGLQAQSLSRVVARKNLEALISKVAIVGQVALQGSDFAEFHAISAGASRQYDIHFNSTVLDQAQLDLTDMTTRLNTSEKTMTETVETRRQAHEDMKVIAAKVSQITVEQIKASEPQYTDVQTTMKQLNTRLLLCASNAHLDFAPINLPKPSVKPTSGPIQQTQTPIKQTPSPNHSKIRGKTNQGEGNSCPAHAAAFVTHFLLGKQVTTDVIDQTLIGEAKANFQEMLKAEESSMQSPEVDSKSAALLQQIHKNSGRMLPAESALSYYENKNHGLFAQRRTLQTGSLDRLVSDDNANIAIFKKRLEELRGHASGNDRVAATVTCNHKTFAIGVVEGLDEEVFYSIFDSHSKPGATVFETTSIDDAAKYLAALNRYNPELANYDGGNKVSYAYRTTAQ